jgi:hypothetical protein
MFALFFFFLLASQLWNLLFLTAAADAYRLLCALLGFQHTQWTIYQIVKYVDVFSTMIHSTFEFHIYSLSLPLAGLLLLFHFRRLFSWALVRSLTHYENIISSLFCVIFFLFISFLCFSHVRFTIYIHSKCDEGRNEREEKNVYL